MKEKSEINQPLKGLNLDSHPLYLDGQKAYTHALNARQESEDGGQMNITNESSTTLGTNFPEGFIVIGKVNIIEIGRTIHFLVNPTTGMSEIGYVLNDTSDCVDTINAGDVPNGPSPAPVVTQETNTLSVDPCMQYHRIVRDSGLGFNRAYPIHKVEYKLTNKTTEIYWTDNYNPMRWLDLNNIPRLSNGDLNINLLSIFPNFEVPTITILDELDTGSLKAGAYQFLVAYANNKGEELSQYYAVTDPAGVWENKQVNTLDFITNKSLKIAIDHLDESFKFANIAVIKTIAGVESFELAVTLPITSDHLEYTYTGNDKSPRLLTREELYFRSPYYTKAGTLESQNNMLLFGNLWGEERVNYQSVANGLTLLWETWRLPYNKREGYTNAANTANLRGYMRDEVYAFDLVLIKKNGQPTDRFPIPGREGSYMDWEEVNNDDANGSGTGPCEPGRILPKWKVYNTGLLTGFSPEYDPNDSCYIGPYQYGVFGYHESTSRYPNDPKVWGKNAGKPIRHHRFPDNSISHIHDSNPGNALDYEHSIYPIGVKVDKNNFLQALTMSDLTQEQKDDIVGFKILRSYRGEDKTVVAKGLLYNVGRYNRDGQDYYYPNYPFNDLRGDPFISSSRLSHRSGSAYQCTGFPDPKQIYDPHSDCDRRLFGFGDHSKTRYTMHSPDLSFVNPPLGTQLKLETVQYGPAHSHIVKVLNNAKYTLGTKQGVKMAITLALTTIMKLSIGGGTIGVDASIDIDLNNFVPAFNLAFDIIKKLIPFREYGYQFNALGDYCRYSPVPNSGNKIRTIDEAGYLDPGLLQIGDNAPINNYQRESSVFIRTIDPLPFPHEVAGPMDNSRFTFNSYRAEKFNQQTLEPNQRIIRDINSYYASIKQVKEDQYGEIYSYTALDTGSLIYIHDTDRFPTVFGGDIFINRFGIKRKLPFFLNNTVGQMDDTDIFYNELANVGEPTYWLSTGPISYQLTEGTKSKFDKAFEKVTATDFGTGLAAAFSGGMNRFMPALKAMAALSGDVIEFLGIKDINLDKYEDKGYFEEGIMYLFAYGISYFFVESDVNLDQRQAENATDKNFFPNVGSDIPDDWIQEKNVSITKDNHYLYNRDLSKNNLANFYSHLPTDFDPSVRNLDHYKTRVIYSEITNIEERQNNWLVYRANNYHTFPLTNGELVDLNALEQQKVLARFENNMSQYNAYITLPTDNKTAVIGSGSMFSNPPKEFSQTDVGYGGTQHKAFCSTKYGHFWVDAKRGEVFQLAGDNLKEISRNGMRNWLKENLPFHIARHVKNAPVDNSYDGVGLAMVWDNRYERLFITKKDYIPLNANIMYDSDTNQFYLGNPIVSTQSGKRIVSVKDPTFFCDASWTIAYSPLTESWVSFYSFTPDYYVEQQSHFQSGINTPKASLWNHLLTNKSYQMFYNRLYPFEIETITGTDLATKTLTAVSYRTDVLRYVNSYDWKAMKDVTFNKGIIHSTTHSSGDMEFKVKDKTDMTSTTFATKGVNRTIVPTAYLDGIWSFNKFSDTVRDANSNEPMFKYSCNNVYKTVNLEAISYDKPFVMAQRQRLKGDWFKIRLSNDRHSRYKFVFKWMLDKTSNSIKTL